VSSTAYFSHIIPVQVLKHQVIFKSSHQNFIFQGPSALPSFQIKIFYPFLNSTILSVQPTLQYLYRHPNNIWFSVKNVRLLIMFLQIPVICSPLIHNSFPAHFSNTLNPTLLPRVTVYVILHLIITFKATHTPSILWGYIATIH